MSEFTNNFKLWKQGAEARIYVGRYLGRDALVKERFEKKYRHSCLDTSITKERIKSEARAIVRCKAFGVHTPAIYLVDFPRRQIYMEHFPSSITIKDFIIDVIKPEHLSNESDPSSLRRQILDLVAVKVGSVVGRLHTNNMIHGDLTTSNILLVPKTVSALLSGGDSSLEMYQNSYLVLIDFGLSHMDSSAEDKGVDLYVLERALISTHNDVPDLFSTMFESYKSEYRGNIKEVIDKFEDVRARGRKRTMVG